MTCRVLQGYRPGILFYNAFQARKKPFWGKDIQDMTANNQAATEKSRLTQAAGEITGRLWCGYHQGYGDANSGRFLQRSGKRWMCGNCLIRRGITVV
jgi:hypothetical protein